MSKEKERERERERVRERERGREREREGGERERQSDREREGGMKGKGVKKKMNRKEQERKILKIERKSIQEMILGTLRKQNDLHVTYSFTYGLFCLRHDVFCAQRQQAYVFGLFCHFVIFNKHK